MDELIDKQEGRPFPCVLFFLTIWAEAKAKNTSSFGGDIRPVNNAPLHMKSTCSSLPTDAHEAAMVSRCHPLHMTVSFRSRWLSLLTVPFSKSQLYFYTHLKCPGWRTLSGNRRLKKRESRLKHNCSCNIARRMSKNSGRGTKSGWKWVQIIDCSVEFWKRPSKPEFPVTTFISSSTLHSITVSSSLPRSLQYTIPFEFLCRGTCSFLSETITFLSREHSCASSQSSINSILPLGDTTTSMKDFPRYHGVEQYHSGLSTPHQHCRLKRCPSIFSQSSCWLSSLGRWRRDHNSPRTFSSIVSRVATLNTCQPSLWRLCSYRQLCDLHNDDNPPRLTSRIAPEPHQVGLQIFSTGHPFSSHRTASARSRLCSRLGVSAPSFDRPTSPRVWQTLPFEGVVE